MNEHAEHTDGIGDAIKTCMNAALDAKVRNLLAREFYRRGCLTWDMKLALRRALARHCAAAAEPGLVLT